MGRGGVCPDSRVPSCPPCGEAVILNVIKPLKKSGDGIAGPDSARGRSPVSPPVRHGIRLEAAFGTPSLI